MSATSYIYPGTGGSAIKEAVINSKRPRGPVPVVECQRHGLPFGGQDPESGGPFWVRRCIHLDNRFVVELRRIAAEPFAVDYVEDLPGGDLVVEAGDPMTEKDVAEIWDDMVARMINGQRPEKDRW